jgi:hypothetical protein
MEESGISKVKTNWEFFTDVIKEQYYPIRNYDDQYMIWTTLRLERGQTMLESTNKFHALHTKLGIKIPSGICY